MLRRVNRESRTAPGLSSPRSKNNLSSGRCCIWNTSRARARAQIHVCVCVCTTRDLFRVSEIYRRENFGVSRSPSYYKLARSTGFLSQQRRQRGIEWLRSPGPEEIRRPPRIRRKTLLMSPALYSAGRNLWRAN